MWPFKPKKEKHIPLELLEKRLKEKNILNDDEILRVSSAWVFDNDQDNSYTVSIFKENVENKIIVQSAGRS